MDRQKTGWKHAHAHTHTQKNAYTQKYSKHTHMKLIEHSNYWYLYIITDIEKFDSSLLQTHH